jgi:hypothetical protein
MHNEHDANHAMSPLSNLFVGSTFLTPAPTRKRKPSLLARLLSLFA